MDQALRMLCDGTEACRERLLRDARERAEGIDAKDEDPIRDAVVGVLVRMKLPKPY